LSPHQEDEPSEKHDGQYAADAHEIHHHRAVPAVDRIIVCTSACDAAEILRDVAGAASQGFTRLTIRGRIHTLPRHVASEAEHERVQAPCSRDFQLLAAKQV
jgi:hypothetical protein